jgi:hypothetical protein
MSKSNLPKPIDVLRLVVIHLVPYCTLCEKKQTFTKTFNGKTYEELENYALHFVHVKLAATKQSAIAELLDKIVENAEIDWITQPYISCSLAKLGLKKSGIRSDTIEAIFEELKLEYGLEFLIHNEHFVVQQFPESSDETK